MILYGIRNEDGAFSMREITELVDSYVGEDKQVHQRIISVEEQAAQLAEAGWKPVEAIDDSKRECEAGVYVKLCPYDAGDRIAFEYRRIVDVPYFNGQIDRLKQELADGDYKVIKNYEASLAGVAQPYEPTALHLERQALRDRIKTLEQQRDSGIL